MADSLLTTDVRFLKGVGGKVSPALNKIGIHTVGDLLYCVPRRYEDRRNVPPIGSVQVGAWVTVRGKVRGVEARPTRNGMVILKAVVGDRTGAIALTWFNQPWIKRSLEAYTGEVIAYGQVKEGLSGLEISSPEWEMLSEESDPEGFARVVPVYPLTEGLHQRTLRRAIRSALEACLDDLEDPLPQWLVKQQDLPNLPWALDQLHSPESVENGKIARQRLVFEEFFLVQVGQALRRAESRQETGIAFPIGALLKGLVGPPEPGPSPIEKSTAAPADRRAAALSQAKAKFAKESAPTIDSSLFTRAEEELRQGEPLWEQIHRVFPFALTGAQKRVVDEIFADMQQPHPMNRLVQGDVGSGKTAVAACAILAAIRSGYQSALMAPTEILAEQHYVNLKALLEPLGIHVVLLVGKLNATDKRRAVKKIESGEAHLAVGTHALIQEGVDFRRLGFVVIDEQHRFGVVQRMTLREKGFGSPDVLVMTATPIPRTLTMARYGDLELSVIDELPPGRKPIKTHWKLPHERDAVYRSVLKLLDEGRQAYFVCPMVSESEKMNAQAAVDLQYRLVNGVFAEKRVALLHGQMKPKEKEEVMEGFRRQEYDILVATTVIEVGVDVPNASMMVIEDAQRFGLSQLHQLRGRVGRGAHQSFCVLIGDIKSEEGRTRLETMVSTTDGFVIAEVDLKLRGPGMIAGTQQVGHQDYKIADLILDGKMLEVARQCVLDIAEEDPEFRDPQWAAMVDRVRHARSDLAALSIS